ncbi:MAG: VWA domain-containing protein [Euryarchaeota archaeon]|nr:VWA domain-containing protein [Euryarchaeota archaeon]
MEFSAPERLYLLLLVPAYAAFYYLSLKRKRRVALKFANFDTLRRITAHGKPVYENYIPLALRLLALALLILALAKPQSVVKVETTSSDIVLAIDVSGSMRATDFSPNRLEAAKSAALVFASELKRGDRLGVVTFSGVSYVVAPLSDDLAGVKERIEAITFGREDGTAIGDGLISAASMLAGSEGRKRVVVLLSDGENNRGVAPEDAAIYAKRMGIKVYTVGIGSPGGVIPGTLQPVGLDEETLKEVASITGGEYRFASSSEALREVYREIARSIAFEERKSDISGYFLAAALLVFIVEFALAATRYRTLP